MSKEYNETKIKTTLSMPRENKKTNELKVQNILSQKKYKINFDDRKYAVKIIKTQFAKTEQKPSKTKKSFLKSIPIIGELLAKIFTSERERLKD
ncbi:hypothetical protein GOY14_00415 [Wolbachia endosymbiont of Dipetalonema caudispina]|uniref:hypothetical protein n=1 Tax=Wolbachia endosymbiont of Dipetalonema caudispina TaxID=1812112 RepID=UPI00158C14BA|nr:hypothetical protein [Wolbachia endosymbiont of Dipetalonema caudispina]QKX00833.1 hypothetical protein GOY14_00415 [Wolbachia endosymbiont of Dipetalonema caudispina]